MDLLTRAANFEFYMVSQRSGRYLKTFLEPVASFSQSISPFRAMATPFIPKIPNIIELSSPRSLSFPNSFYFFYFLATTLSGLDPSQKMHIDCPHLQKRGYGGSISQQRLILLGFCKFQEGRFLRTLYGNDIFI